MSGGGQSGLAAHLAGGVTTLCRCWQLRRKDGAALGFTDHDLDLRFDGLVHRAGSGLAARALSQTTGLAIDNSTALGALSDPGLSEADLRAGRYDGARVEIWQVNWADPVQRALLFRGRLGEISQTAGAFEAELRGLAETLNLPHGRVYQRPCAAVLGDRRCRMDLSQPGYHLERAVAAIAEARLLRLGDALDPPERWFERGRLQVLEGAAKGLGGMVKNDRIEGRWRLIELWEPLAAELAVGEQVRLQAGCDRLAMTCQNKFNNFINFRGFPHLPSEDWLLAVPRPGKG